MSGDRCGGCVVVVRCVGATADSACHSAALVWRRRTRALLHTSAQRRHRRRSVLPRGDWTAIRLSSPALRCFRRRSAESTDVGGVDQPRTTFRRAPFPCRNDGRRGRGRGSVADTGSRRRVPFTSEPRRRYRSRRGRQQYGRWWKWRNTASSIAAGCRATSGLRTEQQNQCQSSTAN